MNHNVFHHNQWLMTREATYLGCGNTMAGGTVRWLCLSFPPRCRGTAKRFGPVFWRLAPCTSFGYLGGAMQLRGLVILEDYTV